MGNSIHVNLNGIGFNVGCDTTESLKKVKYVFDNMFVPGYDNTAPTLCDFNIYFSNDPIKYSKLTESLMDFNAQKFNPNIYKYLYNGIDIYHHYSGFYVYGLDDCYYIISNDSKYAPYHLILELYLRVCEENGIYIFHGNGIKMDDNGINIIGHSHSGKTTLMSKLFQIDGVDKAFLSNDRVLIGSDKTLYFPLEINLDRNTISNDQNLLGKIDNNNPKIYVKPKTFVSCYPDLRYVDNIRNNCFLIPRIDLKSTMRINVKEVGREEAISALEESCFSIVDRECKRDNWIKEEDLPKKVEGVTSLLSTLTEQYRFLSVEYGCDLRGEKIYEKIRKKD